MLTRREYLKYTALAGGTLALQPGLLKAFESGDLITRAIPSTGEKLPIVGLGSSATFSSVARGEDVSALRDVMSTLLGTAAQFSIPHPAMAPRRRSQAALFRNWTLLRRYSGQRN